jgi:hypothetical protein
MSPATATLNCGGPSTNRRETSGVPDSGKEHKPDALTEGLERLRERLARQRDQEDPSVLANRVHDDLDRIHERIRRFRASASSQLGTRREQHLDD